MIHLATFGTPEFTLARARLISSATLNGVGWAHPIEPQMLPPEMQQRCAGHRGFGYWQWKPTAIQIAMRECSDGDFLIYSDCGVEFIGNINYIIDRMDQDIFLFGNHWEHAHWCKADIIKAIMPTPGYPCITDFRPFGKQAQASVIFFRVSDYSRKFVKEWLDWCLFEGGRLIDDSPSRAPNHPEFQENRHDQAILTTLAYREGIKLHYWPARYEGGYVYDKHPEYQADNYPTLFFHHRKRNHEWEAAA